MVLKKRVDYGFRGYRIPAIPRGPRSVRKRGPRKKLVEESQISAFELLAAVAGKLLQENESSASSNAEEGNYQLDILGDGIKHEHIEEDKGFRSECLDQGSCVESAFMPESAAREQNSKSVLDEIPRTGIDSVMEANSIVTSSDFSKDVNLDLKLEICTNNNADGDLPNKAEGGSSNLGNLYDGKINNGSDKQVEDDKKQTGDLIAANTGCLKDPTEQCVNNNALINSESSVQLPLYRDPVPSASFAKHRNIVKLGFIRDDDENSFGCNSTKIKAFRQQSRFGYRRIRKILRRSKYWRVARKLKDSDLANSYGGMKPFYSNRKSLYPRERCLREAPSKRRKLCDRCFVVACHQEASSESISNSPEKGVKGENRSSAAFLQRASGPSASVKGLQKSGDANVKFSIKSFKVPELYIEVPETATVGALKRTVMEAVTSILGGALRVGLVLKGKRVRDDKRTLQQAGISDSSNLEALGFTLEPSFNQVSSSVSPKQPPVLHPRVADHRLSRSPAKTNLDLGLPISSTANDPASVTKIEKPVEVSHEFGARTPADAFMDGVVQECKALVPVPEMNVEALAVVPINPKPKRSELPQRRMRRPFSVAEVEALVEAVEKLGTGRWRDVKMRAFDNADHRTYVDLKDKWKTLVHTASISPQQRRGEPVPQELLDRVLSVHAYWSQHQAKQHGKHHA